MSEISATNKQNLNNWWGRFSLKTDESLLWSIGSFNLHLLRREKEWLVRHRQSPAEGPTEEVWSVKDSLDIDGEAGEVKRYIFSHTEDQLEILPRLADRPVVVNALKPLYVQPGQQVEMYVSTPLWFCVNVHADQSELLDLPISRPSDTWFGPSTLKGQLCYASATQGRLALDDLLLRPHRAMTPITIKNQTEVSLPLAQLCLPTQYLSLFDTGAEGLWTEAVTLTHADHSSLAKVSFSDRPAHPYHVSQKISRARMKQENNMFLHTFNTLFG